jgi:hypothetical protein
MSSRTLVGLIKNRGTRCIKGEIFERDTRLQLEQQGIQLITMEASVKHGEVNGDLPAGNGEGGGTSVVKERPMYKEFPKVDDSHILFCSKILNVSVDQVRKVVEAASSDAPDDDICGGKNLPHLPNWVGVNFLLGDGEGLRTVLNQKWANMGIVGALLLTIAIPMVIQPPESMKDHILLPYFQLLMVISSLLTMGAVVMSTLLIDIVNIWCPTDSDLIYFMSLGTADYPQFFLIASIVSSFFCVDVGVL